MSAEIAGPRDHGCRYCCDNDIACGLAAIMDLIEEERSAATDREKRLLSRIDQLARMVQELSAEKSMAELEIVQDEGSDTLAMAEAVKRRKKKARRAVSDFTVHHGKDCTATESSAGERDTTEDIPVCTSANFRAPTQQAISERTQYAGTSTFPHVRGSVAVICLKFGAQ